jgi:hypothetical protein
MKKLFSVFTDDMDHCMFTGASPVERHHVYGGVNKKNSEKYGFIAPLRPDLHPNGVFAGKDAKEIDTYLKRKAQEYYEQNIGTREQFVAEFSKSYL